MPHPYNGERAVTERELRTILRRAIELDARRDSLITETEVRSIAAQLGVTSTSLNQALEEVYAESRERTRWTAKAGTGLPVALGLFGSLMGVALHLGGTGFLDIAVDRPEPVLAVLAAQNIAILVALSLKGAGRHGRFQVANAALWLGLFSGWAMMDGGVHQQLPGFAASLAGWTAVFGSAGILLRDLGRTIGRSFSATLGGRGGVSSKGRSVAERVARVLKLDLWRLDMPGAHAAVAPLTGGRGELPQIGKSREMSRWLRTGTSTLPAERAAGLRPAWCSQAHWRALLWAWR